MNVIEMASYEQESLEVVWLGPESRQDKIESILHAFIWSWRR